MKRRFANWLAGGLVALILLPLLVICIASGIAMLLGALWIGAMPGVILCDMLADGCFGIVDQFYTLLRTP